MVEVKIALNPRDRRILESKIFRALYENGDSPDPYVIGNKMNEWVLSKEEVFKEALADELDAFESELEFDEDEAGRGKNGGAD